MRRLISHISGDIWLIIAVLLLSLHQATILAYAHLGTEAIPGNYGKTFPNAIILQHLAQVGFSRIFDEIAKNTIVLFLLQSFPAFLYIAYPVERRRTVSLGIWLAPIILGLPTLVITAVYLISPLFAVLTFPGFMLVKDYANKEDLADGILYLTAVIGWFHLFWLTITIKDWFFSKRTKRFD